MTFPGAGLKLAIMNTLSRRKTFANALPQAGRFWLAWCLAVAGLMLGGCSTVSATKPVGDAPVQLDAKEWEGVWIAENSKDLGPLIVKVADAALGELQVSSLDTGDDGKLTLQTVLAQARSP